METGKWILGKILRSNRISVGETQHAFPFPLPLRFNLGMDVKLVSDVSFFSDVKVAFHNSYTELF